MQTINRWHARAAALTLVLLLTVTADGFRFMPAVANHTGCTTFGNNQNGMRDDPDVSCRRTYVHDPGRGNLMSRSTLLSIAPTYLAHGWTSNFLWYSYQRPEHFAANDGRLWSQCVSPFNGGGTCPVGSIVTLPGHTVTQSFAGAVTLDTFTFSGAFITQVCGNFGTDRTNPVPKISGTKFHDRDRNGVRGANDGPLAGWRIILRRESSLVGQPLGDIDSKITGPDGSYRFDLDGHGPGVYSIREEDQDGWTRTTAPLQQVAIGFGVGDAEFGGNDFGNVENRTDVVKVAFDILTSPAEMRADVESEFVLRVVLRNEGPADPVDVEDIVVASGPSDCIIDPRRQSFITSLAVGQDVVRDFSVKVTCTEPSFHGFEFQDELVIITPGVSDTDPPNNYRSAEVIVPVIDLSDIQILNTGLDCPERADKDATFTCSLSALVVNEGPHTPVNGDFSFGLSAPGDCSIDLPAQSAQDVTLNLGTPVLLTRSFQVTCSNRSFHPLQGSVRSSVDHLHVEDPDPSNDSASSALTIPVFEPVDLEMSMLRIACGERLNNTTSFPCTVSGDAINNGPADAVMVLIEVSLTGSPGCVIVPSGSTYSSATLDSGESAAFAKTWNVSCLGGGLHTFMGSATVRADEPHAEDLRSDNDTATVKWGPTDVKPRSFPSSINKDKKGLVPVAILSTPDFDATSQIDRTSLRFGATGFEESLSSCAPGGEDVNDDGLLDLVCHFRTELTGFTCDSTVGILTGRLLDGTPFESQDEVNIVPCRR